MLKIYNEKGFLNVPELDRVGTTYNFVVGGRGVGKTYGLLKMYVEQRRKFVYMRRTQDQIDTLKNEKMFPFKKLNADMGWNISIRRVDKHISEFVNDDGESIGITMALSEVANVRGFDATDYTDLFFEEFIKEPHQRNLKDEAKAFYNAYETMNRNREFEGQRAMKVFAMANSDDIANPIFMDLRLLHIAEKMQKDGQDIYVDRKRDLSLVFPHDSPISEKKAKASALGKLTSGTSYGEVAFSNEFQFSSTGHVVSRPLREYKIVFTVGEISVYQHKSNGRVYVSEHQSGRPKEVYGTDEKSLLKYRRDYGVLWGLYLDGYVDFENRLCEVFFNTYMGR